MFKNKLKMVDKYIIKEVTYPFILGVFIITVILIGNYFFQLTDLIIVKKVPVYLVSQLLAYKIPSVMVETFPIAILFATMTGISRLNRENEITAIRMGGVSFFRLMIPLLIVGIIVSGFTFVLNEEIVPWANHQANNIIRKNILKDAMPDPQAEVFFKGPKGRLFYVEDYDKQAGKINNIMIYEIKKDKFPEVITAQTGLIEKNNWLLNSGIIHQYNEKGKIIFESKFQELKIQLTDEMKELYGSQKSTSEMSREELGERIALFKKSGINVDSLMVDYHLKLAEPLTALIFVLISVPLSLSGKESRTVNLMFTILIVFLYYVILSFSRSFGKNFVLSPLIAAWLPNFVFFILGIILLFWRESWQKTINKIFKMIGISTAVIILIFNINFAVKAEEFVINADYLNYNPAQSLIRIKGNIDGNYGKYYLKSDNIKVKLKNRNEIDIDNVSDIEAASANISGCELEEPHYYFDAERAVIKPGEYIKMYNIVFRELNGKLPLFYWPYLYISLKRENSNFIPSFGYHRRRGWFVKTKYFYNTAYDLPGNFYLDNYSISGAAGGIKQYFISEPDQEGYLYYYTQQNKTNLSQLFNWEAELYHKTKFGSWNEEFSYFYQDYDEKIEVESNLDFYYKKNDRRSRISFDYDDRNYFDDNYYDRKDYGFDFYFYDRFFDDLLIRLNYNRDYNNDAYYGLEKEFDRDLYLRYNPGDGWLSEFKYYDDEIKRTAGKLRSRKGGEFSVKKETGDYEWKLLLERYAPRLTEEGEGEIEFSRMPEISLGYDPPGSLSYLYQLGNYYENESKTKGYRGRAKLEYFKSFYLPFNNYLRFTESFNTSIYNIESADYSYIPNQQTFETNFNLRTSILDNLKFYNDYTYLDFRNRSPFEFDRAEKENLLENRLNYRINPYLNLDLESGYSFQKTRYLPLELYLRLKPSSNWIISLGTSYDLNNNLFEDDLIVKSRYQNKRWEHRIGIEYDLDQARLREIDNQLIYELDSDYGIYFETNLSIDNDYYDRIREANLQLKKKFHCRELAFSYDYLREEFTIQYSLEIFPADSIGFTKNKDDLIFDASIENRLKKGEF